MKTVFPEKNYERRYWPHPGTKIQFFLHELGNDACTQFVALGKETGYRSSALAQVLIHYGLQAHANTPGGLVERRLDLSKADDDTCNAFVDRDRADYRRAERAEKALADFTTLILSKCGLDHQGLDPHESNADNYTQAMKDIVTDGPEKNRQRILDLCKDIIETSGLKPAPYQHLSHPVVVD